MHQYRQKLFEPTPDVRKAIALTKLIDAAVDAQNRHLEAIDHDHANQANLYSAINLLCMKRLALLNRYHFNPVDYRYAGPFYKDTSRGHMLVLAEVRGHRIRYPGRAALGRYVKQII